MTKPNVQTITIHSAAQYFTPENITYENELIWPAKAGSVITFKNIQLLHYPYMHPRAAIRQDTTFS